MERKHLLSQILIVTGISLFIGTLLSITFLQEFTDTLRIIFSISFIINGYALFRSRKHMMVRDFGIVLFLFGIVFMCFDLIIAIIV